MKAFSRIYRGIEFVRLADLPSEQQKLLTSSPSPPERIKILIDGKLHDQCIQYKAYCEWYTHVFKAPLSPATERAESLRVSVSVNKP